MKSKLVSTLLGEVNLDKLKNPKLRKVMEERIGQFSFLFNYGDGRPYPHADFFYSMRERGKYGEFLANSPYKRIHMDHNEHRDKYAAFAHYKGKRLND